MKHHALQLYHYHVWANSAFIEHLKALPADVYTAKVESIFPSISTVLAHIYLMDVTWLSVMQNKKFDEVVAILGPLQQLTKDRSLTDMEVMYLELTEQYHAFFGQQEDMDKLMVCEHPQYGKLETKLSQLVQHVVNHGTYHRGNITAMLRQLGHAGVPTDYIFYLFAQRAEA
ncbi:DinB family protein [Paenibacillus agricola]|uniref:Damage-inducible protein DinB n=1 Tax=Paenibacillus agricola TaxID=2716264 RepID=A0ABX0J5E9_9BACL|nr:DinB family protein [Paenibacillus agricola]NHN31337.1 damage-inducible protein DinB [Paenibacillus agricola]